MSRCVTALRADVPEPFVPPRVHAWKELLVVRDAATTLARLQELRRGPIGRGQTVLVLPGFRTGDGATSIFRRYLLRRGFRAHGWELGRNGGDVRQLLPRVRARVDALAEATGGPIAVVGTSLGGVLAREVARDRPDRVRRVVTLGSPVVGGPKYTQAGVTYRRRGYDLDAIEAEIEAREAIPVETPVTAIYSADDGIVAWPACLDRRSPNVEHVEIACTHIGFAFHAEALLITAERLARDPV